MLWISSSRSGELRVELGAIETYSHAIPAMEAEAAEKVAALVAGG